MVSISIENRIARMVMNRPEKRNALNSDMVKALKEGFNNVKQSHKAKVVILEGAGPAFCAGADLAYLQQLQQNTYEENLEDSRSLKELFEIILRYPMPVIAKVNGHAIAGGCGLATVCDVAYATPESTFGYSEVKIGFIPAIVMVFLSRKIGEGKARELLLTGEIITANVAAERGLINKVVSEQELEQEVVRLATHIVENGSAEAMSTVKEMMFSMPSDYSRALEYAAEMNARARGSEDCKKGISAFLNKQKPQW
jgi:methylglutaconyl-CoA hydratase